jgi:hypothetical protein
MSNVKMNVNVEVDVPWERIRDLLCNALEGGSNYWYRIEKFIAPDKYVNSDPKDIFRHLDYPTNPGGALLISDAKVADDPDVFRTERLNMTKLKEGLKVMAQKYPRHFANFMSENDDADTGDVFLQCALFGDVIYG